MGGKNSEEGCLCQSTSSKGTKRWNVNKDKRASRLKKNPAGDMIGGYKYKIQGRK
jgi:hypothetical protein